MSKTRNNHYVPQWHQAGFLEPGQSDLVYLDLRPEQHMTADGRQVTGRAKWYWPPVKCFRQRDLYSTFFGSTVNDEIERRLFGDIDRRGAQAIEAFKANDPVGWHAHFQTLFEYLDVQKIRTPKGLDWLKSQYPFLTQNDLMREMQAIRQMHSRMWMEGVREIVSAEDSATKFIVSDHPVTIYNPAAEPVAGRLAYPDDPPTAWKGSVTLFPMSRDFCLVLTNLEFAQDPTVAPREKRTFARNFGQTLVRTDAFIHGRRLSAVDVAAVNRIIKARAGRYIAAGREAWLWPEQDAPGHWARLGAPLQPPQDELWRFGGEIFVGFQGGGGAHQDAFGRAEPPRPYLVNDPLPAPRPGELCGCGSGAPFRDCCRSIPAALRPSWSAVGVRERNLMFHRALTRLLKLDDGRDWTRVRRELTDEQISRIYQLYADLWPLETDLLDLLPKPDGRPRAVFAGMLHPEVMAEFAFGASPYFGELLIQSPFIHPGNRPANLDPTRTPASFRLEVLKALAVFQNMVPLIRQGLVNLFPDPCDFNPFLRQQMRFMARERTAGLRIDPAMDPRVRETNQTDFARSMLSLPDDVLAAQLVALNPGLDQLGIDRAMADFERRRLADPLASLQAARVAPGAEGVINLMQMVPNFEIAMYLAQATGAVLVTDSAFRWAEITRAIGSPAAVRQAGARPFVEALERLRLPFLADVDHVAIAATQPGFRHFPDLMRDAFHYLRHLPARGARPNFENQLVARLGRAREAIDSLVRQGGIAHYPGRFRVASPIGGVIENTVNRLLLTSNAESNLQTVPLAVFIERPNSP